MLEARDALATIDALPEPTRGLMRLMATEHTQQEAAAIMGLPIEEVRWRIALGRKKLREAMGRALGVRGHPHFVGVRKDCRKWVASIRQGRRYYHLGYYDTDELAAYAYDLKARELGVPEAKLNFPIPA